MSGKRLGAVVVAAVLLAAGPARAADKEAINEAVERGVRKLKSSQAGDGTWPHAQIGLTALCGLTLLECGEPVDDRVVQRAADAVRKAAPDATETYSLALTILFLDRLGEPVDVSLIESLTVRLLGGQLARGNWTYTCPKGDENEQRRLTALVKKRADEGRPKEVSRVEPGTRKAEDLPRDVREQLAKVERMRVANTAAAVVGGDNSNTQFAVLGLWVARRYGLPVDGALRETERYFRATQGLGGQWDYMPPSPGSPPSPLEIITVQVPGMTCAGLLGIGLAYGAWNETALQTDPKKEPGRPGAPPVKAQDPSKDRSVIAAFHLVGAIVDSMARFGDKPPRLDGRNGRMYYFLWSMERVAVAYGVDTIGKTNWYDFASSLLLANQDLDGSWNGEFRDGPDTCFALLVLRRANLAQDLSRALKTQMKDGMQSALRQGGLGGSDLLKGRKTFFEKPAAAEAANKSGDEDDVRAANLGKQLAAGGERGDAALKGLRDNKGAAYTEALAGAIARLDGDARKAAREALAERLSRMTSATLGVKLEDDDPEVRRAAALAVAMKEDKAHAYKLIEMLDDKEATVMHAAHAALKSLAGEDHGPAKDATRQEHAKAVLAWKEWWARQQKK